jgi:hypothetical protein
MTASFETRPSGTAIAKKARRSCTEAFVKMKPLFLSAAAISLALGFATFYVPNFQLSVFTPKDVPPASDIFARYSATRIISILVWTAVSAPVAVAVHRYILIGQITPGFFSFRPQYTKSFFFWGAGLQVIAALLTIPPSLLLVNKYLAIIGSLAAFAFATLYLIVILHLAMIFPAVATEVPNAHWRIRIANSWKQMKGHSWLLIRAAIVAFSPWVFLYLVLWILFGGLRASQHHGDLQYSSRLGLALLIGSVRIPFVMLGAAVASWLYAWIRQQPSLDSSSGASA